MKNKFLLLLSSLVLLTGCSNYKYKDADKYKEYKEPITLIETAYTTLEIDWLAGDIVITEGESFTISESNLNELTYYPLYYFEDGEVVHVKYAKSGTTLLSNSRKKLEITVPNSVNAFKIDTVSADYNITVSNAKLIEVDTVSGDGRLTIGHADVISIDSTSGKGNFRLGTLKICEVDNVSGDFNLVVQDSSQLVRIEIDTVSGDYDLTFDGSRGYNLDFNSVSGDLRKNFESDVDKFSIKFDSTSGDLTINKAQ